VTSEPVAGPGNIRAEQSMEYDRKTELAFTFDAHITDTSLIGIKYGLQYQLRRDGDDWQEPVYMEETALIESAVPLDEGITRFTYKLSGLEPGTLYSVRVRMTDQNGDASLYTNTLQMRTDIEQGAYDRGRSAEEWINYLRRLVKDLIKKPFWTVKDRRGEFVAVYRPDMFEGLARDGTAPIPLAESSSALCVYYLPARAVATANYWGKGFKIPHQGINIIIAPNAFDMNMSDALMSAQNQVKLGKIKDYYVRITALYKAYGASANGVSVQMETVRSVDDITQWNKTLLDKTAQHLADATLSDKLSFIAAHVDRGTAPEIITRNIDRKKATISREMDAIAAADFGGRLRYRFEINNIEAPMVIIARDIEADEVANAFREEKMGPRPRDVMDFGGDRAIAEQRPGSYVFNGEAVNMAGMQDQPFAGSFNELGAKYYLQDFFGDGWEYNASAPVSRFALAGTIARAAGAPRYAEPFGWLESHMGLSLSPLDAAGESTPEELRRCVEALYKYKTNTSDMPPEMFDSYQRVNMAALHKALMDLDDRIGL
jgi:hypothetical protein